MKNRPLFGALGLILAVSLTACGAEPGAMSGASPALEPAETETVRPANARQAYASALERMLQEHILPDGTSMGLASEYDMADNRFSICDVDGDGAEELILLYNSIMVAGMRGYVFSWNGETGELGVQLETSPKLTFYESGAVQSDTLHNQQLAGRDFWPYSLYRYDAYLDTYMDVGFVHAWGKEALPNGYPEQADKSGTGFVYYIATNGGDSDEPLDASIYEAWRYVYVRDSAEIQLEYQALTEENIQALLEA